MNFQSGSQQPFALVFDFSALLVDNLNWNRCIYHKYINIGCWNTKSTRFADLRADFTAALFQMRLLRCNNATTRFTDLSFIADFIDINK
jgi:hypothetical protein